MCTDSRHIEERIGDQNYNINKKQLMVKHQKRHSTYVEVYYTEDLSIPTKNRFYSLTVEPSLEESCYIADSGLVVAHSQKCDTNVGLKLLTVKPYLRKSCHMADSGLVVAPSKKVTQMRI